MRLPGDGRPSLPPLDGPRVHFEAVAQTREDRIFWWDVDPSSMIELCFGEVRAWPRTEDVYLSDAPTPLGTPAVDKLW